MKIAVNARWLLPNKLEGTGIYTLRMLEQIIPTFPQHEFHLLLDRGIATDQFSLDFPNVHFHVVAPQARHPLLWTLWNDFSVPRALKKLHIDLYWSPDGLPAKTKTRQWLTIHDLNFEHHPEWVPKNVATYYRRQIRKGAAQAQRIFTVSQWSAEDIASTYTIPAEKIALTYNAPQQRMEAGQMNTEDPYFCAVGALTPRKNLRTLLLAFDRWVAKNPTAVHRLKIAGAAHFKDPAFETVRNSLKHADRIDWLGRLSGRALEALYGGSTAYCMPSAMEGFGIPLVEAMQCGTAVIASKNSALTEVVGTAGLLVSTYDVEAWSAALQQITTENSIWRERALQRGDFFNWEQSAAAFIEALQE
jgi:glycosyltransferase involved in cell wall biosynthesis